MKVKITIEVEHDNFIQKSVIDARDHTTMFNTYDNQYQINVYDIKQISENSTRVFGGDV